MLYHFQDKFLAWWKQLELPFYLTGGTALGRFYLNHRYSEDLDFFCNSNPDYSNFIVLLKKEISKKFAVNLRDSLFTDDFTRFYLVENELFLKVEFVNDVNYYPDKPAGFRYGWIDTPLNILSNKLTALVGRDEAKDVYDIIHLSLKYSFSWPEVFYHSKQKSVINEIDVSGRLYDFPIEWFENVNYLFSKPDSLALGKYLRTIADDFLLGNQNSLGISKSPLLGAQPLNPSPNDGK